jgi:hypothetical protein
MTRTRASGPPWRRSARYAGYADPVSLDHDSCGAGRPIRRSHLGRSDRGSARPASRWHRFVNPVKDRWAGTRRTDLPISGIRIIVHRMPLTSAICANKSIRTLMNADERRWMRPKIRPPGPGCLAQTFARGGEIRVTEWSRNGRGLLVAGPSSWPPCSSRRWCQWWRLRHRRATPSGVEQKSVIILSNPGDRERDH